MARDYDDSEERNAEADYRRKHREWAKSDPQIRAFRDAMEYAVDQIKRGRFKNVSANYLREHVRCTGLPFSNTESPGILKALVKFYPDYKLYISIGAGTARQHHR